MSQTNLKDLFGEVITAYTRSDAIADGTLIDVSNMAKEAGFRFPVAITRTVWEGYIVPDKQAEANGESQEGRLWDTLFMLHVEIKRSKSNGSQIFFSLYYGKELITLKAVVGPGDFMEPVITIMQKDED
ncbi:DUF6573 family protein [Aneurinibacillus thermoaerophilus]|jgi:hypothetical protein|uniref:DUF6573 family protein n=1 Tax=Aneurinibacillus thermoaerophilus TaxID=143495 RepID=UPI002E24EF32|nr:hypothetical protein [Aneurinibacillus thermoaerophilus]